MASSCDLGDYSLFHTDDATDHKKDKCIVEVMEVMGGDKDKCRNALTGMLNGKGPTNACTNSDFKQKCADSAETFTLKDAGRYCELQRLAERQFWDEFKMSRRR